MKRIFAMLLSLLMTAALLTACGGQAGLQDGYYTAQMSQFSHGWKEYITILVKGGSIISVEYNAENASGFIKSWDNAYMQNMLHPLLRGPASGGAGRGRDRRDFGGHLLPQYLPDAGAGRFGAGPEGRLQHCDGRSCPLRSCTIAINKMRNTQ